MSQKILNKRSSVFGKAPLPSQMEYGEIAINFNNENPFLSILDSNGEIQKFLSETKTRGLIQDAKEDIDNSFYTKEEINNMFEAFDPSGEVDLDNYYTKRETDNLLAGKSDSAHTHDYSQILNTPDLSNFATLSDIPSINGLASEVWVGENYQPKGNYLTEHQSLENYYTKSEADGKFLTSHQDLSDYAQKSDLDDYLTIASASTIYATKEDLEEFTPTVDAYSKEETDALLAGKANSAHTHDYSQIQNTPDLSNFATKGEIPDTSSFATKQELEDYQMKSGMSAYLLASEAQDTYQPKGTYVVPSDLDDYALKSEIPNSYTKTETDNLLAGKANSAHTHTVSDITDLNIPSVEGLASEEWVSNNFSTTAHTHSDLATKAELDDYLTIASASTTYATKSEIPDISDLATKSEIPDTSGFATKQELEDYQMKSGMTSYLTIAQAEQDLQPKGDYALKSELPDTSNFITSGFCEDRYQPKGTYVVPSDLNNYVTSGYAEETFAKKGDVPTDVYTKSETDTLLAGKASSSHTHTASEIVDLDVPKIWKGTLSEYSNLTDIDPDTLYVITDESEQFVTSGEVESMISGFTNLTEVQTLLEGYSTTAHTHDYSEILNTPDLSGFASLSDIPDTSNFITSGFCEDHYQAKGTYVVPSDLDDYALKTDLPTVPDSYTKTETDNLLAGKANSAHTHTVSDITDLNIPSVEGLASEEWVSNNFSTTAHTHSDLATKAELDDYLTIASASTIYATKEELEEFTPSGDNYAGTVWTGTLSEYNNLTVIDTDTLYVITDANLQYVTSGQVESMTSGYTNLTEVQTLLEGYSTTSHTHSYNDLTDKPTIPSTTGLASEEWVTNNFAGTGHTHSQYAEKTDLANYQPQSGMTDYLTVASASTIYATKEELAEFTPSAGYVQNIWVGSLSDYENLTIVDSNTLYCITDEQEQLVTRSYAMNTFATKAMMSDYLTVSAATEMFVEKEAEPLPAYQFVDYIDVSGYTPGIITDYYLTANSVIEFDSEPASANYEMTLYGVTDADWGGMTEGVYAKYGSNQYTYHGYMAESAVQDVQSGRHTFKAGYNYGGEAMAGCQVDDGEIQTCFENNQSWGGQNNLPLGLFGVWSIDYDWNTSQVTGSTWNNNLGMKFNGKFYGCKVYEGNTLMRDYVPCVETSTGKVGIFDTLSDSFYETTASASTTVTGSSSAVTATTEETTSGETSGETSGSTSGETSGETTGQTAYTIDTSVYEVGDYIDLNRDTYDLNYLINGDSKFVLDIYLQAGRIYDEMFGIEDGNCFKIGTGESEGSVGLIFGDSQTRNTQYYIENDGRYVFEMSSGGSVVNGSMVADWSQAGTVYGMTNSHCHLGGLWQVMVEDWGDGPTDVSSLRGEPYFRMYNFKIYEGNTLLRDYRPVKRLSDDAIGWFDVVNQTFMGRDENNSFGEGASLGYDE